MTTMFYLFAVGSMLGYALQGVLLAHHARKMDGLSLVFYRNLSFLLTLSPLLLGASPAEIGAVLAHWQMLLLAGASGGIYLALLYRSYRYLTVGISGAYSRAVMTVLLAAAGWIALGERLSPLALGLIVVVIAGSIVLGQAAQDHPHLEGHPWKGFALTFIAALFLTATNYAPIVLSRAANPLVAGYFWEVSIGVASGILLVMRWLAVRKPLEAIPPGAFLRIALCAWPTLIGTGLYTLATRSGPAAVVTSIGTGAVVVSSLLAHWLYRERLTFLQWTAIGAVLAGIVGLKFV